MASADVQLPSLQNTHQHSYTPYVRKAQSATEMGVDFVKDPSFSVITSAVSAITEGMTIANINISTIPPVMKGASHVCSIISLSSNIVNIVDFARPKPASPLDHLEKAFKIAGEIASIALGVMASFKLNDWLVSLFGAISQGMGNGWSVMQGISTLAPFTVVFSAIEIAKNTIEIGLDSIAMYRTYKKIVAVREKTALFENMDWTKADYATAKIERLKAKQLSSQDALAKMDGALETSLFALNARMLHTQKRVTQLAAKKEELKNSNSIVSLFGQILPKIKLTYAELKQEAAEKVFDKAERNYTTFSAKHTLRTIKIKNWSIIENKIQSNSLKESDKVILNKFKGQQIEKLHHKKANLKLANIKIGLKIALKVVAIIAIVASIVLTFSGVGTAAGIITGASVSIFIALAKYGLKKFDQYNKPHEWQRFHIPALAVSNN